MQHVVFILRKDHLVVSRFHGKYDHELVRMAGTKNTVPAGRAGLSKT